MSKNSFAGGGCLIGLVIVLSFCYGRNPSVVLAQEGGIGSSATFENGQAQAKLPIKHSSNAKLTDQQLRGAGIFIQRCALCHLSKTNKACCAKSLGPSLSGMFKDMDPEQEKSMREIIMEGGPTYMPAWKYGLSPKSIDDIIAYLKTLG